MPVVPEYFRYIDLYDNVDLGKCKIRRECKEKNNGKYAKLT